MTNEGNGDIDEPSKRREKKVLDANIDKEVRKEGKSWDSAIQYLH